MKAYILFFYLLSFGCSKIVQIDPPVNTITTTQVFADSSDAGAAVAGLYSNTTYVSLGFGNGLLTFYPGLSSDELLQFGAVNELSTNTLLANNGYTANLWNFGYSLLYQPNAIIAGLQASATLPPQVKNEFLGEAKWFRAYIDFYLVNLFGDIPLITTINYKSNALARQAGAAQVYDSILLDLKESKDLLPSDYSAGGGERVRVNKFAAAALLARVYLYLDSFPSAEVQATSVINNSGLYSLDTLNGAFLADNPEAILQWQNNSTVNQNTYNATIEALNLIPSDATSQPNYYLTDQLLGAFENGDLRKTAWIDSTIYNGATYYYPYKYKVGPTQMQPNGPVTEYYTVLRLAEQYLIRAEARAMQNNLSGALDDLNMIRNRAGLDNLSSTLSQPQIIAAVAQERRVELFAEWGHRWFDLKRTKAVAATFSTIPYKSRYQPYQQLYPIPPVELQFDPNLTQNPGYH
jgi:hypothetical protein